MPSSKPRSLSIAIPYSTQSIDESDVQSVLDVLRSGWLTQGPRIRGFETALQNYCEASFATVVSNGTAALHLACRAVELGPGDCLWTSPNTFVASANCALYCGAQVDFVDIDPATRNLDIHLLEEKLKKAKKQNKLPKIIVAVHFAGHPCDMEKIYNLCHPLGITVVEDASHALGGFYKRQRIGSCQFSDMTIFSFHPVKNMTTGEGGAILANLSEFHEKLRRLRSHGITRNYEEFTRQDEMNGSWYYEQQDLGFNYRLTDFQCALGISQLKRLDSFIKRRRQIFDAYQSRLAHFPLKLPVERSYARVAWHLYVIEIQNHKSRAEVFAALKDAGINVNVHYIPIHMQPYYTRLGFKKGDFPNAEAYYEKAISLPLYPDMPEDAFEFILNRLEIALQ